MKRPVEPKTFLLVQGFCHSPWHWNRLQEALDGLGHNSLTFELPTEDPTKNFDDYAEAVARAASKEERLVGVFHSRAGNYGPRAVNRLNIGRTVVTQMIFLCSSFEAATLHALGRPCPNEEVPPRNSQRSREAIVARPDLGQNMKMIDPVLAPEVLYHDIADLDLVRNAIAHLRPQNRPQDEPPMISWPRVQQHYILAEDDRMVSPKWSEYAATQWLGVEPVRIPGGHSPFLSRPQYLAQLLVEMTSSNLDITA